jgi:hypothetical protein
MLLSVLLVCRGRIAARRRNSVIAVPPDVQPSVSILFAVCGLRQSGTVRTSVAFVLHHCLATPRDVIEIPPRHPKGHHATHARLRLHGCTVVPTLESLRKLANSRKRQQPSGPIQSIDEPTGFPVRQHNNPDIDNAHIGHAGPDAGAPPSWASSRFRRKRQYVFILRHTLCDVEPVGKPGTIQVASVDDHQHNRTRSDQLVRRLKALHARAP